MNLQNKNVLVFGTGISGIAAAGLLEDKGAHPVLFDGNAELEEKAIRAKLPEAGAFHMSGKTEIESKMHFRREGVPMGLPGLDEWHISVTSEEAVREAKKQLL